MQSSPSSVYTMLSVSPMPIRLPTPNADRSGIARMITVGRSVRFLFNLPEPTTPSRKWGHIGPFTPVFKMSNLSNQRHSMSVNKHRIATKKVLHRSNNFYEKQCQWTMVATWVYEKSASDRSGLDIRCVPEASADNAQRVRDVEMTDYWRRCDAILMT